MKYFLIAGERSGDLHGSNLIKAIIKKDPDAEIQAFGGDFMQDAGAEIILHYREMAIMGFVDVLKNIFKIKRFLSLGLQRINSFAPHALILIDFAGFNLQIAKRFNNPNTKKYYYIVPKIWAWNQKRAFTIKKSIDRPLVILPFEEPFYARFGVKAKYVGNPVFDAINNFQPDKNFAIKHKILDTNGIIALLPGSRKQELKYVLPILHQVVRQFPHMTFGLSIIKNLPEQLYNTLLNEPNVVPVVEDNYNLLFNAEAAIVTSGTATLETALFDIPQVVIYKTSTLNYTLGKLLIKVNYISLVNLIADANIVKELIQDEFTAHSVSKELKRLIEKKKYRKKMLTSYKLLRSKLGPYNASENAAKIIFEDLGE